jgi:hypothetical protein
MSTLLLRIHKYLDGEAQSVPMVPVNIYPINKSAGGQVKSGPAITEMIAVSHRAEDATQVSLTPGRYYVESVLPSGETLSDDVTLQEGGIDSVVMSGEAPSDTWLSWQDFVGNTGAVALERLRPSLDLLTTHGLLMRRDFELRDGDRAGADIQYLRMPNRRTSKTKRVTRGGKAERSRARRSRAERTRTVELLDTGPVASGAPIRFMDHLEPVYDSRNAQPGLAWRWLAECAITPKPNLIKTFNVGKPAKEIQAYSFNPSHAVFRFDCKYLGRARPNALGGVDALPRVMIVVPRRSSVELINLPMPWVDVETGREASMEVATRQVHSAGEFCSSATAMDARFGVLVGYLSTGALPTARSMAKPALNFLRYKMHNPFAAAAGGYAMVGTALTTKEQEWHGWTHNLMEYFPTIPDGAIQWGTLRLRMRRKRSDVAGAIEAFKTAYRRGLPYFSMGVKWLMEGLEFASHTDVEAREMLSWVREVAWRTNYQQAFTSIRLPEQRDV